jgi:hypothetical protein
MSFDATLFRDGHHVTSSRVLQLRSRYWCSVSSWRATEARRRPPASNRCWHRKKRSQCHPRDALKHTLQDDSQVPGRINGVLVRHTARCERPLGPLAEHAAETHEGNRVALAGLQRSDLLCVGGTSLRADALRLPCCHSIRAKVIVDELPAAVVVRAGKLPIGGGLGGVELLLIDGVIAPGESQRPPSGPPSRSSSGWPNAPYCTASTTNRMLNPLWPNMIASSTH